MATITLVVDDRDEATIREAMALYQRKIRWPAHSGGGVMIPIGTESDTAGALIAAICWMWSEPLRRSKQ